MTMPTPALEYAQPRRGVPTWMVWQFIAFTTFATATFLVLLPDLHNDNPFWPTWVVAAPLATIVVVRLLPRERSAITVPLISVLLLAFWTLGGFAVYHRFADLDPHVTSRAHYTCMTNLRWLGDACRDYATDHVGRFPDRLSELVEAGFVDAEKLVARYSSDTPAPGPTTRDIINQLDAGGHCSYIYLGKGLTTSAPGRAVVLYEPLSKHAQTIKGAHILYVDGTVSHLNDRDARRLITELESGHNPPRDESPPARTHN